MAETKQSEAQIRALKRYHDKFQQVKFYFEPELYLEVKDYCEAKGESMTAFIKRICKEEIERNPL